MSSRTLGANCLAIYHPAHGGVIGGPGSDPIFANPMEFICSAIQAGSRLGYQDSAELCAQYLAPFWTRSSSTTCRSA